MRTLVVEDDDEECLLIKTILEDSDRFEYAGSFSSAEGLLKNISDIKPELVLMDIRLPGISGIECAQRLKEMLPRLSIIIISGLIDAPMFHAARQAGCAGYVIKPFQIPQFVAILCMALDGDQTASSCDLWAERWTQLTERERMVVRLIARGRRTKDVADDMQIPVTHVDYLVRNVFATLRVGTRSEAVEYYLRAEGWAHQ